MAQLVWLLVSLALGLAGLWLIGIAATFFLRKPADAAAPHAIH